MTNRPSPPRPEVPPSVDWWVTSRCTLKCDFCYGPAPGTDPRLLRRRIAESLASASSQVVTFCGGEPLLVKELEALAELLRAAGKRTVLNTNGELLRRRFSRVGSIPFDVVGISVDGATASGHRSMRGEEAMFDETLAGARWVKERACARLKIATVVSRVSLLELTLLADVVRDLAPDVWRLYQYSPWGKQNHAQQRHCITTDAFNDAVATVTDRVGSVPVRASTTQDTRGCLIIDPDARVLQPGSGGYRVLGSCLDEPIDAIWARVRDRETIHANKRWLAILQERTL